MKTVFDKATRDELITRIGTVTENSTAQWGKMRVDQMLRHCSGWEEMIFGNEIYKQAFIGRLFGKMALQALLKDEKPLRRNTPTTPQLRMEQSYDVASERTKWITLLQGYADFSRQEFTHPFFGKMTKEQIGYLAYKHSDHHLRQFNC
jgi:hypothetical protein